MGGSSDYYQDFISNSLTEYLLKQATPVDGIPDLMQIGESSGLETAESFKFLTEIYLAVKDDLQNVLNQRIQDRRFIDQRVQALSEFNKELGIEISDPEYKTIIGLEDSNGRIVLGPKTPSYCRSGGKAIAPIPDFLQGPHVTLFGPPDSAKMAINAMNAYHRKLKDEPAIVEELLKTHKSVPKWGADDEDSKTPLRKSLVEASVNLTACFEGNLSVSDGAKTYELAKNNLSIPIKRFPGLALPCTFLFHSGKPIPLHLYDFALHLYRNWANPRALVFYVPKLENEEEAQYIHKMIQTAEALIKRIHPEYKEGSVRLMIVIENPRAILRTHEIMDALHPYFVGASLGWHDFLASTARVFKEDSHYRIPVKADPNIVIKYIKASHLLLADVVGSRGGIEVGGMYGILPLDNDVKSPSFQMTLLGYFKDVITQLKRDLTGFWVAHPDFVRIGLALVEAWNLHKENQDQPLKKLVESFLDSQYHKEVFDLIKSKDIEGLSVENPNYVRSLIVADIKESDFIPNNHPDEIRYNVFQSLQYITDWLCGNGCVALPSMIKGIPVRVMDDLATAERSRWEVWHELYHQRFPMEEFLKIVFEEMNFIRRDLSDQKKIVQVKWNDQTKKWYPIAMRIMLQLMTDSKPAEFASELLLPFTIESVRNAENPWFEVNRADPEKYKLSGTVERFCYYFDICGALRFAQNMAHNTALDLGKAKEIILSFSETEIIEAATFHGNIGEGKKTLDSQAAKEQSLVLSEKDSVKEALKEFGEKYKQKFGFKFLIAAKGKTGTDLLDALKTRLENSKEEELKNAREALWQISLMRLNEHPFDNLRKKIEGLAVRYSVPGASIAISLEGKTQFLGVGKSHLNGPEVSESTYFELASLSKPIASAFAIEYFRKKNIPLSTSVNMLLNQFRSKFNISNSVNPGAGWQNEVTIEHLLSHSALNMHYVKGFKKGQRPSLIELMNAKFGYEPLEVIHKPGSVFSYSGGGFLVLEYLIECLEGRPINEVIRSFLDALNLEHIRFDRPDETASGYFDTGDEVPSAALDFPLFAAGAFGTAKEVHRFLGYLADAYHRMDGSEVIAHDTAVKMLHGTDKGCLKFMGCKMGLGIFVGEAGENRLMIHQGANEGFRALFIYCFEGPDKGKGFTILCNADNRGVFFIAELAQEILRELKFSGIRYEKFKMNFDVAGIAAEQFVNAGYRDLIFSAFIPDMPESIEKRGPLDPLAEFNLLVNSEISFVTNQKFARAENLKSPHLPTFDPELFGRQGKIMDSWESARHNQIGFDFMDLRLSNPSQVNFVSVSTKFHDGNQAEFVRILGKNSEEESWKEILPKTNLKGHALYRQKLKIGDAAFSFMRIEMYPDGGITRVGLYKDLPPDQAVLFLEKGTTVRFTEPIPKTKKPLTIPFSATPAEIQKNYERRTKMKAPIDLASQAFGGSVVRASNEHYGPAVQVNSPFPPIHMFDGLESSRSRDPNHFEEVIIKLGKKSRLSQIEMDFKYFINNNPLYVSIMGLQSSLRGEDWLELVTKEKVKPFAGNKKIFNLNSQVSFEQILVRVYPDGGINRIKVFGL